MMGEKSESFSVGAFGHHFGLGRWVEARDLLSAGLWEESECFDEMNVFV